MTIIAIAVAGVVAGIIGIVVGIAASRRATRAVRECNDLVQGAVGSYGTVDPKALRDVAIVRYDALNEMSGQLSFSLALLNAVGDGVVLSSINGRAETRTYAKPVVAGRGEQELSPEEAQAVHSARASAGVPAAGEGSGHRDRALLSPGGTTPRTPRCAPDGSAILPGALLSPGGTTFRTPGARPTAPPSYRARRCLPGGRPSGPSKRA